jgi:hypothetical protein
LKNVKCVGETEILVEQHPPQGVSVCDHAGLVINKFSLGRGVHGSQIGVWDIGFGCLGMRAQVSGFQGARAEKRTPDILAVYRASVQGLGFRVWGVELRV